MWDPPRPGLEPVSPALAGRFSTTAPPGKPQLPFFLAVRVTFLLNRDYNQLWQFTISLSSSCVPRRLNIFEHQPLSQEFRRTKIIYSTWTYTFEWGSIELLRILKKRCQKNHSLLASFPSFCLMLFVFWSLWNRRLASHLFSKVWTRLDFFHWWQIKFHQ